MRAMNQRHAAGRKTENSLGLLGQHLDRQLALLTQALGNCLTEADSVPRDQDQYGHHRAGEIAHAVTIAKTSAKLVASLAKVSRQFQHNIVVSHEEVPPKAIAAEEVHYRYPHPDEMADMTDEELAADIERRRRRAPPLKSQGSNG